MRTYTLPALTLLRYGLLIVGALAVLAPLAYMLGTSFKPNAYVLEMPPQFIPRQPTLDNYVRAVTSGRFGRYFLNSLVVAACSSGVSLAVSSMMAYGFARWSFPGKSLLFYIILGTMMVPAMTLIIPQFVLAKKLGLLNSIHGLIVAYSAGTAFNMFLLRGFFEELPQELFDSATVDGAGTFQTFWKIALPLARPALAAVIIFAFLGAWDEFTWALTVINNPDLYTLPIALRLFQQRFATEWGLVFAASVIIITPPIAVFLFFQRHFIKGLTSGALKG
jgi:multiple sugar transport system permease protein